MNSEPVKKPGKCLRGFEHINRYWDKTNGIYAAKILPGEYYVTTNDEAVVTVLGSCVSACVRDKVFGVGGMNHFMLPANKNEAVSVASTSNAARYGNFAMEQMINDILKHGGVRENLEIKIFGGGKVLKNMSTLDIGNKNIEFIREYILTEHLKLISEDVGDIFPRKVMYFPLSGRAKVKKLRTMHNNTIVDRETRYLSKIDVKPVESDIELF